MGGEPVGRPFFVAALIAKRAPRRSRPYTEELIVAALETAVAVGNYGRYNGTTCTTTFSS